MALDLGGSEMIQKHSNPISLRRDQLRRGVPGIDTTVKSAVGSARCFAPTWDMVLNHKSGKLDDQNYTIAYLMILDKISESIWQWLYDQADQSTLAVLCYCGDNKFCHTHILIDYATSHYPHLFQDGRNEQECLQQVRVDFHNTCITK